MDDDEGVIRGKWWKSGQESVVVGELNLDNEFRLHTHDCLDPVTPVPGVPYAPQWVRLDAVHGRSHRGLEVTLLDVTGTSLRFGDAYTSVHETWRPRAALLGSLVDPSERFMAVRVELSGLAEWAHPRPLVEPWPTGEDQALAVHTGVDSLLEVDLGAAGLSLSASSEGTAGARQVSMSRTVAFNVELHEAASWDEVLTDWVWPLRQFLSFVLVDKVVAPHVHLRPEGHDSRSKWPELRFSPIEEGPQHDRAFFDEEVLFVLPRSPVPIEDLLATWFAKRDLLHPAVVALVSAEDASFLYAEHAYLLRLTAAESAHALLGEEGHELPPVAHAARVEAIVAAASAAGVAEADIKWAEAVLRSRNDKPLRARLNELVEATGEVGALITAKYPTFVRDAVKFRTPIAHIGAKSGAQDSVRRWRVGEALGWMARTVLLAQCGVPRESAEMCVLRHERFGFLAEHLVAGAEGDA